MEQGLLPAPDVVSFNIALAACAKAGETSLALGLFDEMRTTTTTTTSMAAGMTGGGEDASLSPAPRPNRSSFNSVLSACAKGIDDTGSDQSAEFLRRALEILEAMRTGNGGAPSPNIMTYKEVVNAYGR